MTRIAPLALAFALSAVGCTAPGSPSARVERLLGPGTPTRLVTRPEASTTIEAWRIDGMAFMERRADGAQDTLHGYPVLAGPVPVDAESAAVLADVLGDDDTYLWDVAKGCEFLPGVAVRWREGEATVDVLFCFSCDELETYVGDARVGHEDFDPRRRDLVRVAQRLFPEDAQIRELR